MYKAGKAYLTPTVRQIAGQTNSHIFSDNWCKIDCYNDEQLQALFHTECCYLLNGIPHNFKGKLHKQFS